MKSYSVIYGNLHVYEISEWNESVVQGLLVYLFRQAAHIQQFLGVAHHNNQQKQYFESNKSVRQSI